MRRFILMVVVLLTALLASLSLLIGCNPAYKNLKFTVEVKAFQTMTQVMNRGEVFEGYLTVTGGDKDLLLYARDPTSTKVMSAVVKGKYDFYFDNAQYLSPADKEVYLRYVFR